MTASNAFTPTGSPRRRSHARTPREHLLRRMAQDRREHVQPMTPADLDAFIADHLNPGALEADQNNASAEFVLGVELNGCFPPYLRQAVNPAMIETGERFDRVFVRFEYFSGRTVTLFPSADPDPVADGRDWMDYEARAWADESPEPSAADLSEMAAHFSLCDYRDAVRRMVESGSVPDFIGVII